MAQELAAPNLADLAPEARFRVWLAANGLYQQDAAERLGISDSHLSYVLRGRRGVNAELAAAIAKLTGGFVVFPVSSEPRDHSIEDLSDRDQAPVAPVGSSDCQPHVAAAGNAR